MGGDRNAEKETKVSTNFSGPTTNAEEFRRYSELFKPCLVDNAYLPAFTLSNPKGAQVSIDEIGNARIYDNCNEVFRYGPNEKESFVWISDKSGETLSETDWQTMTPSNSIQSARYGRSLISKEESKVNSVFTMQHFKILFLLPISTRKTFSRSDMDSISSKKAPNKCLPQWVPTTTQ